MMRIRPWAHVALLVCSTLLPFAVAQAADPVTVQSFSPRGATKAVEQVVARFSSPMVSFGDPSAVAPFNVECTVPGNGRWVNQTSWVYDFERTLPGGIRCQFKLKRELRALNGSAVSWRKGIRGEFSTGGPSIIAAYPYDGSKRIDENQIFFLTLDAVADPVQVVRKAYCAADGIGERIGVKTITGDEREALLKQNKSAQSAPRLLLLQCKQKLPAGKRVQLLWPRGITTDNAARIATAQAQRLTYKTRPAFAAKFTCRRTKARGGCVPALGMTLNFSAPVPIKYLSKIELRTTDGRVYRPDIKPQSINAERRAHFSGPMPRLKNFKLHLPNDLRDDANRPLSNAKRFPLAVRTGEHPPMVKFPASFGIIESKAGAALPLTVRNVEPLLKGKLLGKPISSSRVVNGRIHRPLTDWQIMQWYQKVKSANNPGRDVGKRSLLTKRQGNAISVPKPLGGKPMEVVGIDLKEPGFYVVELASPLLAKAKGRRNQPYYAQTSALVTDLAAHFKHGRESSLVWVTRLNDATPVAGARVVARDCQMTELWSGKTDSQGIARIGKGLKQAKECDDFYGFFVSARTDDDMTFVLSDWQEGISTWRFNLPAESGQYEQRSQHTVFDRTLLRAGDTVHMKLFDRARTSKGFAIRRETLADTLTISHAGSGQQYEVPVTDIVNGTGLSQWSIPKSARLGTYYVSWGGSFEVQEFRVPTMKAIISPPKEDLIQVTEAPVDLQVNYLSGGGASELPVKVRWRTSQRTPYFAAYPGFSFSNNDPAPRRTSRTSTRPMPSLHRAIDPEKEDEVSAAINAQTFRTMPLTLDGNGGARVTLDGIPQSTSPQTVRVELEYPDANGELLNVASSFNVSSSNLALGIKPDGWAMSKENLRFKVIALDIQGKPLANKPVAVDMLQRKNYSHRRRLIGGFYSYQTVNEVKPVGQICQGKTNAEGLLSCDGVTAISGQIILRARAKDAQGNPTVTTSSVWIAGEDDWWFDTSDNDRIDLLPEKKRYEPGETARLQVRMPFRKATALVTVEREGILDAQVRELSGKAPVVTVPVLGNHAPNMFVSVLAVRGRAQKIKPTAIVDLGKPSFKLGLAQINVGWQAHELKVSLETSKDTWKVRDTVPVSIQVSRADGKALPANAEVALAAVDQGLLELKPNDSWKLLESMMRIRPAEVHTSTAQLHVVGKRHFGKKALPPGGGGGSSQAPSRELFEPLLLWKGRVALDAQGRATVNVPLNDSLTRFRIVAVANAGPDLFGTGGTDIRSTQDLMILSGLPPVIRQSDRFAANFTLRNATKKPIALTLRPTLISTNVSGKPEPVAVDSRAIEIAAGQSTVLTWPVKAPADATSLRWQVAATDNQGKQLDNIKVSQLIKPVYPVRVFQSTISQARTPGQPAKPLVMSVKRPVDALPGPGGVRVQVQRSIAENLSAVQNYMRSYPYSCLEQRASKALVLDDSQMWQDLMNQLPAYLDSDGLARYYPVGHWRGNDALTAFLLSIAHENGWEIPSGPRERMLRGLNGFVQGRVIRRGSLPTADLSLRKVAALDAISRYGWNAPEVIDSLNIEPKLWPSSGVLDWINVLERTETGINKREELLAQAKRILRSRLNFQGSTMSFSTESNDNLWWLMVSPDVNAARALLTALNDPASAPDMARMARGLVGRQQRGKWSTTAANAWGTVALRRFSAQFESEPVTGATQTSLNGQQKALTWREDTSGGKLDLNWPDQAKNLTVEHQGNGNPWITVQSRAALVLRKPISSGYRIKRTVTPIEQKTQGKWSRGDVMRITLKLTAQADKTMVVVSDPIPAGSTILGNTDHGGQWNAFEERSFDAYRANYEFVRKGSWEVSYSIRLNNAGTFRMPVTRIEAMYAPEAFAETPNKPIIVQP